MHGSRISVYVVGTFTAFLMYYEVIEAGIGNVVLISCIAAIFLDVYERIEEEKRSLLEQQIDLLCNFDNHLTKIKYDEYDEAREMGAI